MNQCNYRRLMKTLAQSTYMNPVLGWNENIVRMCAFMLKSRMWKHHIIGNAPKHRVMFMLFGNSFRIYDEMSGKNDCLVDMKNLMNVTDNIRYDKYNKDFKIRICEKRYAGKKQRMLNTRQYIDYSMVIYGIIRNMIKMHKPDAILLTGICSHRELLAIQAADDENTKVIIIPHGFVASDYSFPKGFGRNIVYLACCKKEKKWMEKKGIRCITGNSPYFKHLVKIRHKKGKNTLVITTNYDLIENESNKRKYRNNISYVNNNEKNVVIKMHPSEKNDDVYREIAPNARIKKSDLMKEIMDADRIYSFGSSAEFDALYMGKQVIRFHMPKPRTNMFFDSYVTILNKSKIYKKAKSNIFKCCIKKYRPKRTLNELLKA